MSWKSLRSLAEADSSWEADWVEAAVERKREKMVGCQIAENNVNDEEEGLEEYNYN